MDEFTQQQIQREMLQEQMERQQMQQNSPTMFNEPDHDNLIKWQLDIKEELIRIEHLLRKHVPTSDGNGNIYYKDPDEADKLFNELGVNEIMNVLAWYLNKNIILSNFSEDEIKLRCKQFQDFLSDFIYWNYQRFGLDTQEKIKHYPMVVMNITNTVEAAYNRALNGGERESLRTGRQVTQSEPLGGMYAQMNKPKRSMLKPWTW